MDDGFEQWYQNERTRVERVVLVVCGGDPDVAADATDEAMARAYERWSRVRHMDNSHGWVTAVALNVARRKFRRRSQERRLLDVAKRTESEFVDDDDVSTRLALWDAVGALPQRSREVVALRYVSGLTEDQIATALKVKVGTVSSILTRARQQLRGELGSLDGERRTS